MCIGQRVSISVICEQGHKQITGSIAEIYGNDYVLVMFDDPIRSLITGDEHLGYTVPMEDLLYINEEEI